MLLVKFPLLTVGLCISGLVIGAASGL